MVKKLVISLCFLAVMLAVLWLGMVWYAMANAHMALVSANGDLWRQRFYLTQGQISLDYDSVEISSHYLLPAVTIERPKLYFTTPQGNYTLTADAIEIAGSFTKIGQLVLYWPERFTFKNDKSSQEIEITSAPAVMVRSSHHPQQVEVVEMVLNEFKLADATALEFSFEGSGTGGKPASLRFNSYPSLVRSWNPIRHEIHPYLQYFAGKIEALAGQHASHPLP